MQVETQVVLNEVPMATQTSQLRKMPVSKPRRSDMITPKEIIYQN